MHITVRGRRWRIERRKLGGDLLGRCDPPDRPNKEIAIKQSLRGQDELDVLIHEILHAAHWDLAEEAIDETASDVARALWRLGWRKTDAT